MNRRNPIASLLKLRSIRERQARADFGLAQRDVQLAAADLETRRRAHDERPEPPEVLTAVQLRALQLQGIRSLELVAQAAMAYDQARLRAEQARDAWLGSTKELDKAKSLERRRREEAARLAQTAAQRALDQLIIAMRGRPR